MSARTETWAWLLQRLSGAVLAVAVIAHLVTIAYAVQGGLSAAEIADRLQGSIGWLAFYGAFVTAAAVHAPIGLRSLLVEWTPFARRTCSLLAGGVAAVLLWTGWRAALALYGVGSP